MTTPRTDLAAVGEEVIQCCQLFRPGKSVRPHLEKLRKAKGQELVVAVDEAADVLMSLLTETIADMEGFLAKPAKRTDAAPLPDTPAAELVPVHHALGLFFHLASFLVEQGDPFPSHKKPLAATLALVTARCDPRELCKFNRATNGILYVAVGIGLAPRQGAALGYGASLLATCARKFHRVFNALLRSAVRSQDLAVIQKLAARYREFHPDAPYCAWLEYW